LEKEEILDSDKLLRQVQSLNPNFIKPDGTPASSSFSLKRGEDGLSVDVERLSTYEKSVGDRTRFRLFWLLASFTNSIGFINEHDPLEDNYAHALIKGNFSRKTSRQLARNAKRIAYPD